MTNRGSDVNISFEGTRTLLNWDKAVRAGGYPRSLDNSGIKESVYKKKRRLEMSWENALESEVVCVRR
jgi:hypothetical protein